MGDTSFGGWIRSQRKSAGLNQTQLGELLGLTQAQVSQLETGKQQPDSKLLGSLEGLFGTPSDSLTLTPPPMPKAKAATKKQKTKETRRMAKSKTKTSDYRHEGEKRTNIPPAKIAAEGTIPKVPRVRYAYNPHLPPALRFDPAGDADRIQGFIAEAGRRQLTDDEQKVLAEAMSHHQPWLEWAGKREEHERGFFEVDPVALHIHERVSSQAIVRAAMRRDIQRNLFADPEQPYQEAVQFYQHDIDWANRLILGDCLQVMSSLARREDLAGKVQMIYIDPPYGIRFGSNFQPEVGRRDVRDGRESDLSREPETVKAYRDTWSLGIHSYLRYLRDRLIAAKELLADSGSVFVQISDENLHHARELMDDTFGAANFVSQIAYKKTTGRQDQYLDNIFDSILWYAKNFSKLKYRQVIEVRSPEDADRLYPNADPIGGEKYSSRSLESDGIRSTGSYEVTQENRIFVPQKGKHWKVTEEGMARVIQAERTIAAKTVLRYKRYESDWRGVPLTNMWTDTGGGAGSEKVYVVQSGTKAVERCILMSTDPGDLVLDPTCGSGTTAYVAESRGRRWITIDTSRVALAIARQRILTATYDHYELRDPSKGLSGGFKYATVPHVTLGSIANNANLDPIFSRHGEILQPLLDRVNTALKLVAQADPDLVEGKARRSGVEKVMWEHWQVPPDANLAWPQELQDAVRRYRLAWRNKMDEVNECIAANADQEELVDQPEVVKGVVRVSGPFTVEGVAPEELSLGEEGLFDGTPDDLLEEDAEDVVTEAQAELENLNAYLYRMVQLLRQDGVTFPNNQHRVFARLEPLFENATGSSLHAEGLWEGEQEADPNSVAIYIGPQYAPVTAQQVEDAIRASKRYDELVIAGFSFDAEASATIQEGKHPKLTIHQALIRPDVNPAMEGLLKDTPNSQLFTVFGQPEVEVRKTKVGEYEVELTGVDIYDPITSMVRSTGAAKVAAWFLDQDFDGRCFCITQAFFPDQNAWDKIAKALGSSADAEAFEAFKGTVSLPFKPGKYKRIAVKVIDPRGNEVMAIRSLDV